MTLFKDEWQLLKGFDTMTPHLLWKKYSNIIERFRYEASSVDLSSKIESALGIKESTPLVFQLKMEIKRQNKSSKRPLRINDFCEGVDAPNFCLDDIDHCLDELSKRYFMQLYKKYSCRYTVGVQELVIQFIKNNKSKILENQELLRSKCLPIDVSDYIYRKEDRIYIGVKSDIYFVTSNIGEKTRPTITLCKKEPLQCVTQNISVNGLKAKTSTKGQVGRLYLVRYVGMREMNTLPHPYICYKLIKCEVSSNGRDYEWFFEKQENRYHIEFDKFTSKLISDNRVRNKVDTTDIERYVLNNLAEQYFTSRQKELVLFFDGYENNAYAYGSYFSKLNFIFFNTPKGNALSEIIKRDDIIKRSQEEPIYWLINKNEDGIFHSSVITERVRDKLFFKKMAKEKNTVFFKVTSSICVPNALHERKHNTPEKYGRETGFEAYSERIKQEIKRLKTMVSLTPLDPARFDLLSPNTDIDSYENFNGIFSDLSFTLNEYSSGVEFIQASIQESRQEERFKFDTRVVIKNQYGEIDGFVSDISTKGLSVIFENEAEGVFTSTVDVCFPEIKSPSFNNTDFKYKVIEQKNGVLRLFASPDCKPNATKFLGSFLKLNSEKLRPTFYRSSLAGLENTLRSLYNKAIPNVKGLGSITPSKAGVTHVNVSEDVRSYPIFEYTNLKYQDCDTLKKIMLSKEIKSLLMSELKGVGPPSHFSSALLCIGYVSDDDKLSVIATKLWREGEICLSLAKKLERGLKGKKISTAWFQFSITKKARISSIIHLDEYKQLKILAPHKTAKMDDLVRSTAGIFDMTPIDDWFEIWEVLDSS
jgi:hypothetical protein